MSYFNNDERFLALHGTAKDISVLLEDEMLLISGNFYGIQKFIFDRLSTKNASKVLRAKSAYIELFTEYLALYVCTKLGVNKDTILSTRAGKFELLVPKIEFDLKSIQKTVDDYFIKNFYGLTGVIMSSVPCTKSDFSRNNYQKLRQKIDASLEKKRFHKFNLADESSEPLLSYDTNIDNGILCTVCNIRKIEKENCSLCNHFIKLGQKLSYSHEEEMLKSDEIGMKIEEFVIDVHLTKEIKSYVLFDGYSPADFKVLAEASNGLEALAILKADVDGMGNFFDNQNNDLTSSFEKFDAFSQTIDRFFSVYVPQLMADKYTHTYTVFAGGDDLFLLGAWNEVLALAREIEQEFKAFVLNDTLTLSFGIAIAKPTTPISYLAHKSEELLEHSKELCLDKQGERLTQEICEKLALDKKAVKDAITLFDETVCWREYKEVFYRLESAFEGFEVVNSATLYRLLEICDMSKYIHNDMRNSMWKSKLNYFFSRNIEKKYHFILKELNALIEVNPEATKMFLSEFIYKRREV